MIAADSESGMICPYSSSDFWYSNGARGPINIPRWAFMSNANAAFFFNVGWDLLIKYIRQWNPDLVTFGWGSFGQTVNDIKLNCYGYKTHILQRKEFFDIISNSYMVATNTRQILYNDAFNLTCRNILEQLLKIWMLEVASTIFSTHIKFWNKKFVLLSPKRNDHLLVLDRIVLYMIVDWQASISCRYG